MHRAENKLSCLVIVDSNLTDYGELVANICGDHIPCKLFSSGEDGLRAASAGLETLWVVNFRLPDMPGTSFLTLLRRCFRRPSVFLVSDEYSADEERAARAAGATAYVCKPPSIAWLAFFPPRCR